MRIYYVRKEHTAFQLKNLIPSVKHGGGSMMAWACFAASWPGQPAIIDGTMNSELYQQILKENVRTSCLRNRVLRKMWVMQQDNNSKHTSHSTIRMVKENEVNVWNGVKSPDINPIKRLWKDRSKQLIGGNPPTSQSLSGSALRNVLKFLYVIVQDWSAFTRSFTFSYCSKRRSHQILKAKIHILLQCTDM